MQFPVTTSIFRAASRHIQYGSRFSSSFIRFYELNPLLYNKLSPQLITSNNFSTTEDGFLRKLKKIIGIGILSKSVRIIL